jgi:serine/threonine-protein kinase
VLVTAVQPNQPGHRPGSARSSLWRAGALIGGRYRIDAPIGAGAMGEVWRADHVTLGTTIAVKLVDASNREDAAEILGRFEQEARAAASLRSPHVVQIVDYGTDGRVAFIAMELLEGESLEQRLARRGRLMPSEAAHILREMARGVDRAHAAGIVHRDLKPPNVFLARLDGLEVVKVLDFGIAKFLGVPREAHLQTQAGFVVGTPAYMSPEQVLGRPVDQRSDLWQMAIIAFECVTGTRPFDGATLGQLFLAICSQPLPVPSAVILPGAAEIPAVLAGFDAWFARAASRDPAQRFGSAGEMAEALGAIFAPGGAGESAIPTVASTSPRTEPGAPPPGTGHHDAWSTGRADPRPPKAPMAPLAGLVLAPLLLLAAGGLWWWQDHRRAGADLVALSTASAAASPITTPPAPTAAPAASASAAASAPVPVAPSVAAAVATASSKPPPTGGPGPGRRLVKKADSDRIGL